MKEILRTQDKSFDTKASKVEFYDLREKKLDKEELDYQVELLIKRIEKNADNLVQQKKLLDFFQENMQSTIYEAVKKANASIIKAQEKLEEKKRKIAKLEK